MDGLAIVILTVVAIFGFIWIVAIADRLLGWVVQQFQDGSATKKILLLIPLLLLLAFSIATGMLAIMLGLFAVYFFATSARNWWHGGK